MDFGVIRLIICKFDFKLEKLAVDPREQRCKPNTIGKQKISLSMVFSKR